MKYRLESKFVEPITGELPEGFLKHQGQWPALITHAGYGYQHIGADHAGSPDEVRVYRRALMLSIPPHGAEEPVPDAPLSELDQKMEVKAREVAVWYHVAKRVFGSIQLVEGQMDEVKSRFYCFEQFGTDKQPDLERWHMAVDGAIAEHVSGGECFVQLQAARALARLGDRAIKQLGVLVKTLQAEREIRMREAVEFIRNTPGEIITSRVIPESRQARAERELAQLQATHHLAGGELDKMTAIMNKEGWYTHHPEDLTASPEASLKRFTPSERLAHPELLGRNVSAIALEWIKDRQQLRTSLERLAARWRARWGRAEIVSDEVRRVLAGEIPPEPGQDW